MIKIGLVAALTFLAFGAITCSYARAQEHLMPMPHPELGTTDHWYDQDCCNLQDCRQISGVNKDGTPWSEIRDLGDHLVWESSKSKHTFIIKRKYDPGRCGSFRCEEYEVKIKPSKDAFYHGCEDYSEGYPYAYCIYEPLWG